MCSQPAYAKQTKKQEHTQTPGTKAIPTRASEGLARTPSKRAHAAPAVAASHLSHRHLGRRTKWPERRPTGRRQQWNGWARQLGGQLHRRPICTPRTAAAAAAAAAWVPSQQRRAGKCSSSSEPTSTSFGETSGAGVTPANIFWRG